MQRRRKQYLEARHLREAAWLDERQQIVAEIPAMELSGRKQWTEQTASAAVAGRRTTRTGQL